MTCTAFNKGKERASFLDSLGGGLYSLSKRLLQTTVTDEAAIAAPATCNSPSPDHSRVSRALPLLLTGHTWRCGGFCNSTTLCLEHY